MVGSSESERAIVAAVLDREGMACRLPWPSSEEQGCVSGLQIVWIVQDIGSDVQMDIRWAEEHWETRDCRDGAWEGNESRRWTLARCSS